MRLTNADADGALCVGAGARYFRYWLEYDAAELEGNERKRKKKGNDNRGEGMAYLSRTVDLEVEEQVRRVSAQETKGALGAGV